MSSVAVEVNAVAAEFDFTVVDIVLGDGLFAKQTLVPNAGTVLPQHVHTWDHVSFISQGSARVWNEGVLLGDYMAPAGLIIRAGCKHVFATLEDNTVISCIHRVDRTGEIETGGEQKRQEDL